MNVRNQSSRYWRFAQRLAAKCRREDLAEAARLLALELAVYEHRYGPLHASAAPAANDQAEISKVASRGVELLIDALDRAALKHTSAAE